MVIEDIILENLKVNEPRRMLVAAMSIPEEELIGNAIVIPRGIYFRSLDTVMFESAIRMLPHPEKEEFTRNIPNVPKEQLANLDERGIIKSGIEVSKGDILIGKLHVNYKPLTIEEKLLHAQFGRSQDTVKDISTHMPYVEGGIVTSTSYLTTRNLKFDILPSGVLEFARVCVAILKFLELGDILADEKGNRGTVLKVSPLYVSCTGFRDLGREAEVGAIVSPDSDFVNGFLRTQEKDVWYGNENRVFLYGPNIGKQYTDKLSERGYKAIGKAMVGLLSLKKETEFQHRKINARSIGHYDTLSSQQPIVNDSPECPQGTRISEQELSALESFPAISKEAITIRSDSVDGRSKIYEELIKNG